MDGSLIFDKSITTWLIVFEENVKISDLLLPKYNGILTLVNILPNHIKVKVIALPFSDFNDKIMEIYVELSIKSATRETVLRSFRIQSTLYE